MTPGDRLGIYPARPENLGTYREQSVCCASGPEERVPLELAHGLSDLGAHPVGVGILAHLSHPDLRYAQVCDCHAGHAEGEAWLEAGGFVPVASFRDGEGFEVLRWARAYVPRECRIVRDAEGRPLRRDGRVVLDRPPQRMRRVPEWALRREQRA